MKSRRKIRARRRKLELKKLYQRLYVILPYLLAVILSLTLAGKVRKFVCEGEYFDVRSVEVFVDGRPASPELRAYYGLRAGGSITKLDLGKMAAWMRRIHPEARNVSLTTYLPDRLKIEVVSRKPVAQLKSERYYPVDAEGMVLADVRSEPLQRLTVIVGADGTQGRPVVGQRCRTKNLAQALELLAHIQRSGLAKSHKLRHIDSSDPRNLAFYIGDPEVEIRVGESEFRRKLLILFPILDKIGQDLVKLAYIDLRFKDPVVGPRLRK